MLVAECGLQQLLDDSRGELLGDLVNKPRGQLAPRIRLGYIAQEAAPRVTAHYETSQVGSRPYEALFGRIAFVFDGMVENELFIAEIEPRTLQDEVPVFDRCRTGDCCELSF